MTTQETANMYYLSNHLLSANWLYSEKYFNHEIHILNVGLSVIEARIKFKSNFLRMNILNLVPCPVQWGLYALILPSACQ